MSDLIPNDPAIRLVQLEGFREIGPKRNLGCSHAAGEIICHWDDDDWSAPGRLADQVERLIESGKQITGYRSMRFTDGVRWWKFSGSTPDYALGTSLCYRRDWWAQNPFRNEHVGEDGTFVGVARQAGAIVSVDAEEMMYATIHSGNTSPRDDIGRSAQWKEISV